MGGATIFPVGRMPNDLGGSLPPGLGATPDRRHTGRGRRGARRAAIAVLSVLLVMLLVAAGGFGLLLAVTPSTADARQRVQALAAADGAAPLAGPLPDRVVRALLATEDTRFFSHHGVDPTGAVRATVASLAMNGDVGGATLEQQLAKILYTGGRRGFTDRVEQVALAVKLDVRYSKTDILRMYLDTVYFGHGYYGVTDAAWGYFDHDPAVLTWTQASMLAGLVQAPSAYDPYRHPEAARARQRHVLDRLVATGDLTRPAADAVLAEPLDLR
ncbi:biosynthetic peptidoglycan transglycosylase [Frankia sp. Cj3]|uniref:biosynthetic peptidoglycan transglycosylase n=1 Tax=Frankia sp. Cj3 TaxID=2880976 RepID=UPI001EF5B4AD|nr:biosynthetic peptidoglycan transglycosylase [Frankia sp. Cj3]